jgi:hypothetical protein
MATSSEVAQPASITAADTADNAAIPKNLRIRHSFFLIGRDQLQNGTLTNHDNPKYVPSCSHLWHLTAGLRIQAAHFLPNNEAMVQLPLGRLLTILSMTPIEQTQCAPTHIHYATPFVCLLSRLQLSLS